VALKDVQNSIISLMKYTSKKCVGFGSGAGLKDEAEVQVRLISAAARDH